MIVQCLKMDFCGCLWRQPQWWRAELWRLESLSSSPSMELPTKQSNNHKSLLSQIVHSDEPESVSCERMPGKIVLITVVSRPRCALDSLASPHLHKKSCVNRRDNQVGTITWSNKQLHILHGVQVPSNTHTADTIHLLVPCPTHTRLHVRVTERLRDSLPNRQGEDPTKLQEGHLRCSYQGVWRHSYAT